MSDTSTTDTGDDWHRLTRVGSWYVFRWNREMALRRDLRRMFADPQPLPVRTTP